MKKNDMTEEIRQKMKVAAKLRWDNLRYKNKIKKAHSHELPKTWKENISKGHKGKPTWNKGLKGIKTGFAVNLMKGKNHYNWKGGMAKRVLCTKEYALWRSKVFERDNWTCQTCGKRGIRLEAHHKLEVCNYPELMFKLDNGVTLCYDCHQLTKKGSKTKIQKDKFIL